MIFIFFLFLISGLEAAELKLDSSDGSSSFSVLNSGSVSVGSIDSSGNTCFRGGFRLDSDGTECTDLQRLIVDQKMGVSTVSPATSLHVMNGSIRALATDIDYFEFSILSNQALLNCSGAGNMDFRYGGVNRLSISPSGNFLLRGGLRLDSSGGFCTTAETAVIDGSISIALASAPERLSLNGMVSLKEGISPSPTAGYGKIFVKSSDSSLYFMDDSGNEYNISSSGGGSFSDGGENSSANRTIGNNDSYSMAFVTSGTERLYAGSTGNIGIGTSSPGTSLEVNGDISGRGLMIASAFNSVNQLATRTGAAWGTVLSCPVYIPAGTSTLMGKINFKLTGFFGSGTGYVRFKIGSDTSSSSSSTTLATWITSSELTLNTSSTGWQTLVIEGYDSSGSTFYVRDFHVYAGDQ